ncbi:YbaK/EbsC family protein [Streptomyces sp. NPDC088554]|uniref:YbaK/EbsC family protein n=1 Tax=Streptomyces sp. NPDC088554 TaxID=3365865 RepID=UPI0037FFCCAC
MRAPLGDFDNATPAVECLDLLTPPVADAVRAWRAEVPVGLLVFVDTEPALADPAVFRARYGPELLGRSADCVVMTVTGGAHALAACVVLSSTRIDLDGVARGQLAARTVSFASTDDAAELTGMEYGGITPIGLPTGRPLLVDAAVLDTEWVLIGSGRRRGKLIVPGKALGSLPCAVVVEGLGVLPRDG